jgi:hypothetical protein
VQFGTPARRYIGAELLPERTVDQNEYTEDAIAFRTVIANAGTRYSPVQLKKGVLSGSMSVKLAHSDIGSEFTARDYDALLRALASNRSMTAMASFVRFITRTVVLPLAEWNERARWQAMVSALVQLRGDNGYSEDVGYSNPAGHRAAAGAQWSNDANDPYTDIFAMVDMLAGKGMTVRRILTSRAVITIMANNAKVVARTSKVTISAGSLTNVTGRVSSAELNAVNQADGLPAFETYDLAYRTQTGYARFMPADVMVFICTTDRDETIELPDSNPQTLFNTLGYTAIGTPAGIATPGRRIRAESFENKPPRIESEGWQASLPVIQEPEAIAVIHTIT